MKKVNSKNLSGSTYYVILGILKRKNSYGYEISKILFEESNGIIDLKAGALYPILKKMETQKFIKSEWVIEENSRARKYYKILAKGIKEFDKQREELSVICSILNKFDNQ